MGKKRVKKAPVDVLRAVIDRAAKKRKAVKRAVKKR